MIIGIFMSKYYPVVFAIILFLIPFFWMKPGYVDFGGDAGKLYFLDPLAAAANLYNNQIVIGAAIYSMVSYEFFLYIVKAVISSPTFLIAFEHGVQLGAGFFSIYLLVKELMVLVNKSVIGARTSWIGVVSGFVYVALVTKVGWPVSMQTQNQVFLNPLIFYLLLRFLLSFNILYASVILLLTVLYAGNFGFTSMPQIASFYPMALLFIVGLFHFAYKRPFPWKTLSILGLFFVGLHAFHIIPSLAVILDRGGEVHNIYLGSNVPQSYGVNYFDMNHGELGKLSEELFQPSQWNGQNIFVLFIPLIVLLGFFKKPSKLLLLLGLFFAVSFFLVSANITQLGTQLYRFLFYIPGFSMFRSFNEKWYFVYAFFYSLVFAVSFYLITKTKRSIVALLLGLCVIGAVVYRIYPFLAGRGISTILWQSKNVSSLFVIDPNLVGSVNFVRQLPDNGKVLTLPLTFPYYQLAYGIKGGAYEGISIVQGLGGKKDFSGFWAFGSYQNIIFDSFRSENIHDLMQLFSLLNIRYIFYNSDTRIMDNFPGFPYILPGGTISSKDQLPLIKDQQAYGKLLSSLPIHRIYQKGFYSIYEIENTYVRPTVYIPDVLFASDSAALNASSYRSAFGVETGLNSDSLLPVLSFSKISKTCYDVTVDLKGRKDPFVVVLSEDYHTSWALELQGKNNTGITHIHINGNANGWIVDPQKIGNNRNIHGTIKLGFQRYYLYGWVISGVTCLMLTGFGIYILVKKQHEKS